MSKDTQRPPPNAYLLSVSVENLRCFGERQTLDLSDGEGRPARWTVILGDNGVGKTSLLQALAVLGLPFKPLPEPRGVDAIIRMLDLPGLPFAPRDHRHDIGLRIDLSSDAGLTTGIARGSRFSAALKWKDNYYLLTPDLPHNAAWECYGYGALRRLGRDAKLSEEHRVNSETLFRDDADLINATEWFLQADYAAARDSKNQQGAARRLELIKSTLIDLLPDVQDVFIQAEMFDLYPEVVFRTIDGNQSIQSLGLGYRTTIAWVVDLAARMFRRYPDSPNPIAEPAVVLIDEIDLHLHPSWQRRLIGYLAERFVNTQFIVTAHSPVVVQAAEGANIAVLRREGDQVIIDQRERSVQGWRVDQLLTSDLFELPSARSARYDDLLAERRALLEKRRLSAKDKARLRELDERMTELPTGDNPEDADAMRIIREAAAILKRQGATGT